MAAETEQYLVQLLLPLADNDGNDYPEGVLNGVKQKLIDKFGGVTAFSRAPAHGVWAERGEENNHDDIVIVEVMTANIDRAWWNTFRQSLERDLRQESVIIRASAISML